MTKQLHFLIKSELYCQLDKIMTFLTKYPDIDIVAMTISAFIAYLSYIMRFWINDRQ